MATYIQGVTDYIPQIQPFKPDLNFFSKVLQMKQDKYDAAKRELSSIYGNLLYSPLTRKNNIERRDQFFKNIEQEIKKISSLDLSLAQNQDAAMKVFEPLINDKMISHDIVMTKHVQTQLERGESFRRCADPKKCGGSYSPESMTYLNMKLQDYADADDQTALSMNPNSIQYVPFNNLIKDAIDWAKTTGFLDEEAYMQGGYIMKKQNGQTIKLPIQQLWAAAFGKDPKYREHYKVLAYLNKKGWVQQNLSKFNDDPAEAEAGYYNDVISTTVKKLKEDIQNASGVKDKAQVGKQAMVNHIRRNGVSDADVDMIQEWFNSEEEAAMGDAVDQYYKELDDRISNLSVNKDDRAVFGSLIEDVVADGFMKMDLKEAANTLADTWNTVTDIQTNQFHVNAQNHGFKVKEMMMQHDLNLDEALKIREMDIAKETILAMKEAGLPDDQEGIVIEGDPSSSTKAGEVDVLGIYQKGAAEGAKSIYSNQRQYNTLILNSLKKTAGDPNIDDATRKKARMEIKAMVGSFYDETNNVFVNSKGARFDNYNQLVVDQRNEYMIYKNGQKIFERNKTVLLRPLVNNAMQLAEQTNNMTMLRDGYAKGMWDNNRIIMQASASVKDVKDPILFNGLFQDSGNGNFNVITSEEEYVKKMMDTRFSKPMSPEKKKEYLGKKYREYYGLYKDMHNDPGKYGINGIKDPWGNGLGQFLDGGITASGRQWSSNYLTPNSHGNRGFLSYMKNIESVPGQSMAVMGTRLTRDEYEDEDHSKTAELIFKQYAQGLKSGSFATESAKEKAPRASVTYNDVAAGNANLVSVSLTNINPEWLKTLATDEKKTKIGETLISDIVEKGATYYLSKEAANNIFTKQFKQRPGDVYINQGLPYNISRPNGGSLTIQKEGNSINISGHIMGYDGQGNLRRTPANYSIPADPDISGEKLINDYTMMLNETETENVNFLQNGGLPTYYNEQELLKALEKKMSPQSKEVSARIQYFRQLVQGQ